MVEVSAYLLFLNFNIENLLVLGMTATVIMLNVPRRSTLNHGLFSFLVCAIGPLACVQSAFPLLTS